MTPDSPTVYDSAYRGGAFPTTKEVLAHIRAFSSKVEAEDLVVSRTEAVMILEDLLKAVPSFVNPISADTQLKILNAVRNE